MTFLVLIACLSEVSFAETHTKTDNHENKSHAPLINDVTVSNKARPLKPHIDSYLEHKNSSSNHYNSSFNAQIYNISHMRGRS